MGTRKLTVILALAVIFAFGFAACDTDDSKTLARITLDTTSVKKT